MMRKTLQKPVKIIILGGWGIKKTENLEVRALTTREAQALLSNRFWCFDLRVSLISHGICSGEVSMKVLN